MDKTPCYFDMIGSSTLHFKGEKNVDGGHSGHEKSHYMVVLCTSLSGKFMKTLVIFIGLKNIPKCNKPPNIEVAVTKGGFIKEALMVDWIEKIYKARGSYFATRKSLLLMDNHRSHNCPAVLGALNRLNAAVKLIPAKTTSFLQPLDVGVNASFKAAMREEWKRWFEEGPKDYTPAGYCKKLSYDQLPSFVSATVKSVSADIIQKSFIACGAAPNGQKVAKDSLNRRLKTILCYNTSKGSGIETIDNSPFPDLSTLTQTVVMLKM